MLTVDNIGVYIGLYLTTLTFVWLKPNVLEFYWSAPTGLILQFLLGKLSQQFGCGYQTPYCQNTL